MDPSAPRVDRDEPYTLSIVVVATQRMLQASDTMFEVQNRNSSARFASGDGANSMSAVIEKPAMTAACVPTVVKFRWCSPNSFHLSWTAPRAMRLSRRSLSAASIAAATVVS